MKFNKTIFFIATLLYLLASPAFATNSIIITDSWSPEAPPVVRVMAGYMVIHNNSSRDIAIIAIKSKLFRKVEIHNTVMKNKTLHMVRQDKPMIKAGKSLVLEPGKFHMMLIGRKKPLKAGDSIPVTISFDNGKSIKISLPVRKGEKNKKTTPAMKCGGGMKCGVGMKCGASMKK